MPVTRSILLIFVAVAILAAPVAAEPSLADLLRQATEQAERDAARSEQLQAEIEQLRRELETATKRDEPIPAVAATIRAIARWDAVPHQAIASPFEVGVDAYHMAGIDRVEFDWDADPEPEHVVREASRNPRTGVVEYWFALDPAELPAGPIELSAIVHPRVGISRTLAGPLNADTVHNGDHGLPLVVGVEGVVAAESQILRVGPTREHKTIAEAINRFGATDIGGRIIELDAGTYAFGGGRHPYATTDRRWLTIRPAPGVDRADVRIIRGSLFRASKVHLQNVTLVGEEVVVGRPGDAVWLGDCRGEGSGLEADGGVITGSATGPMVYVTGGTYGRNRHGLRQAVFTRGVTIDVTSGVAFGGGYVVNSRVLRYDRGDTDNHGDVWHWFESIDDPETTDNAILHGVRVERWPTQGIYVEEPNRGSKAGQYVPTLGSLALVDVTIDSAGTVADALVLAAGVGYLHLEDVRLTGDISYRRGTWGPQLIDNVTAARWLDNPPPEGSVVIDLELTDLDQSQSVITTTSATPN